MKNDDIRGEIKASGFKMWQIAEAYQMQDSAFSRLLRHELPEERKNEIRSIIEKLKKESA